MSNEKLKKVRIRTISASTPTLLSEGSTATVLTRPDAVERRVDRDRPDQVSSDEDFQTEQQASSDEAANPPVGVGPSRSEVARGPGKPERHAGHEDEGSCCLEGLLDVFHCARERHGASRSGLSRTSLGALWKSVRGRNGPDTPHACTLSASRAVTTPSIASCHSVKGTWNPSPVFFTTCPSLT
jgi:hypothetical protein